MACSPRGCLSTRTAQYHSNRQSQALVELTVTLQETEGSSRSNALRAVPIEPARTNESAPAPQSCVLQLPQVAGPSIIEQPEYVAHRASVSIVGGRRVRRPRHRWHQAVLVVCAKCEWRCRKQQSRDKGYSQFLMITETEAYARDRRSAGAVDSLNTRCTNRACSNQMSMGYRHRESRAGNSA